MSGQTATLTRKPAGPVVNIDERNNTALKQLVKAKKEYIRATDQFEHITGVGMCGLEPERIHLFLGRELFSADDKVENFDVKDGKLRYMVSRMCDGMKVFTLCTENEMTV